jgi:biotin carboxyl carrier protein
MVSIKRKSYIKFVAILMLASLVVLGSAFPAAQANGKVWTTGAPVALAAGAADAVAQVSSLDGTVVADGLVAVGTAVKEGQVLVMVKTFAGNAPAARASIDGTVVEVLVVPGSEISAGQVVVKIKP